MAPDRAKWVGGSVRRDGVVVFYGHKLRLDGLAALCMFSGKQWGVKERQEPVKCIAVR